MKNTMVGNGQVWSTAFRRKQANLHIPPEGVTPKQAKVDEGGPRIGRVVQGRNARGSEINLLTIKGAARYKRISSAMEDKDVDDEDPDH
jgi:hypothetical protein